MKIQKAYWKYIYLQNFKKVILYLQVYRHMVPQKIIITFFLLDKSFFHFLFLTPAFHFAISFLTFEPSSCVWRP